MFCVFGRPVRCGGLSRICRANQSAYRHFPLRNTSTACKGPRKIKIHASIKLGAALCVTGVVAYAASEPFKHVVNGAERIGVVTFATIKCFSLYKKTLDKTYSSPEERAEALKRTHKKAADVTLKALETNGGVYIKLGQHLTALTYLLPPEWTETMLPLQDRCPQSSMEEIDGLFKKDLGSSIAEMFSDFDPHPVGVASLAQVHIATIRKTGERVAVKVQHPSLSEFVPLDVFMTKLVFELMLKVFPEYPLTWLGDEMQNSIFVELDFTNEAKNARNTARLFKNHKSDTALRIPNVVEAHKRVLIMEYVPGARLDNLSYMKKNNISTAEVSSCLSHIFSRMIFMTDVGLHCDPHGGNLAIVAVGPQTLDNGHNFEIILYDHGLYRDIPVQMKRDYARFWLSVLDGDVDGMRKYSERFAGIKGEQKFRIFVSAITGRTPEAAFSSSVTEQRSDDEMISIQSQLSHGDGLLEDLMYVLSSMPRVVLLILKTNDLTRNLDEGLNNPLGPKRTFLILANYCARAVYDEDVELISQEYSLLSIKGAIMLTRAWWSYHRRIFSLYVYDFAMMLQNARRSISL